MNNTLGDIISAFEAMNVLPLDEIVNTGCEPARNTSKDLRIRTFLYQLCQNDTEQFIVEHLFQGFTFKEIGKLLGVSKQSINYHLNKLQVRVKENNISLTDVV